ncbi:hypothetical protein EAH89_26535 [Roseomonas nepalensis]|uniref:Integral membrane bound transporter domain-containing protein n=1 Tax=Muricoccus nepalensis TaxID=1854500 RepID=A0A502F6R8_9PROT|nr:FUSC family protein [Roseomonas nepalensis]TPG44900.1 hypothetical protein EAH89_26535 [Roseomonas nepalensis]
MLSAGLGMGLSILLASAAGNPAEGLAASLGSFLVGSSGVARTFAHHLRQLLQLLAAAGLAMLSAASVVGLGPWTEGAVMVLGGAAATMGGYSRPLALGAGRFIVFLAVLLGAVEAHQDRAGLLILITVGATLTSALQLVLGALLRWRGWDAPSPVPADRPVTTAQRYRRWRQTLRTRAGWQYASRLAPCLAVAGLLNMAWPEHRLRWITLTVAILCQRQGERPAARTFQRSIGAALGAAAMGLVGLTYPLSNWLLALSIAALGVLSTWLRALNYLAYTATVTLLLALLLDGGQGVNTGIMVDRVVATVIGAGLVLAADLMVPTPRQDRGAMPRRGG